MNACLPGIPPPVEGMARSICHCGCGCWFYQRRKPGRRLLYINAQHYRREKYRREVRKMLAASVPGGTLSPANGGEGPEGRAAPVPSSPPAPDRERA